MAKRKRNLFSKDSLATLKSDLEQLIGKYSFHERIPIRMFSGRTEPQLVGEIDEILMSLGCSPILSDANELSLTIRTSHVETETSIVITLYHTKTFQTPNTMVDLVDHNTIGTVFFQVDNEFIATNFRTMDDTQRSWFSESITKCVRHRYSDACIIIPECLSVQELTDELSEGKQTIWSVHPEDGVILLVNDSKGYSVTVVEPRKVDEIIQTGGIKDSCFVFYTAPKEVHEKAALLTTEREPITETNFEDHSGNGPKTEPSKEEITETPFIYQWALEHINTCQNYLKKGHTELGLVVPTRDDVIALSKLDLNDNNLEVDITEDSVRYMVVDADVFVTIVDFETFSEKYAPQKAFHNYLMPPISPEKMMTKTVDVSDQVISEDDLEGTEDFSDWSKQSLGIEQKKPNIHDSGNEPRVFESGFKRDSDLGKAKWSYLPPNVWQLLLPNTGHYIGAFLLDGSKDHLECALLHYTEMYGVDYMCDRFYGGALKYGFGNWAQLGPLSVYLDSLGRHMWATTETGGKHAGEDPETLEEHTGAVMWNIAAMIHLLEMVNCGVASKELLDVPVYEKLVPQDK